MRAVFGGGIVGLVLIIAALLLGGWLGSTMLGVIIGVGWGAAAAAKWFAWPWITRVLIGAVLSESIFPVWVLAILLSIFLTVPLFAH